MLDRVENHVIGSTVVRATVAGDVADIGRRLREGDATVGWGGDPSFSLHLAVECDVFGRPTGGGQHVFEVYGTDAHANDYLVLRWPRCDVTLLRRLAEITQTNAIDRALAHQANIDRERASADAERRLDIADRLHFALMSDLGHLYGQRRRLHAVGS